MNKVVFHGVRGSIACPGPRHKRYGGNTSCVEVLVSGKRVIFDAGTGLRPLGDALLAEGGMLDLDIFLSHGHVDHICGIPFFQPLFEPHHRIRFHGPEDPKILIGALMSPPLYPIDPGHFRCEVTYLPLTPGEHIDFGPDARLSTCSLNHPGGALGYRIDAQDRSFVYACDLEHGDPAFEKRLISFAAGADILVYDAMYDDRDFDRFKGFGHSTWQKGAEIAKAAGVKTYAAFHHDPAHDDQRLDQIAAELLDLWPQGVVAREGLSLLW